MTSPHPPTSGMIRLTHLIYALHAFATVFPVFAVFQMFPALYASGNILLGFVTCLPLLVAIALNYRKRSAVCGTWLDSHFAWQIRTFRGMRTRAVITLFFTLAGFPLALVWIFTLSEWTGRRMARGWWRLADGLPMPAETA